MSDDYPRLLLAQAARLLTHPKISLGKCFKVCYNEFSSMAQDSPSTPPPSRPGRDDPWRKQRMVQRVPAHLDEATGSPPWLVIAGVALVIIIACTLIFFALGGTSRLTAFGFGSTATPTRTRTPASAPVTIIPVILNTATPTAGPTAVSIKYKVKSGDTLSEIADKYHVPVAIIKLANGLKDETIRIGDELIIPLPTPTPRPGATSPPGGTPTPISLNSPPSSVDSTATPGVIRHIVQRGDTLIGIAILYGSTVNAIKIANQLDSDALSVGQALLVPGSSWTPTPIPTAIPNAPPTATSEFSYAAPSPNSPPDNSQFHGGNNPPTLTWLSPAILKPGEYYVVHIESGPVTTRKIYPALTVRQGTSAKLDASYYAGATANGTVYSWYVVIVSQTAGAQMIAQSPPSATRTFVWY